MTTFSFGWWLLTATTTTTAEAAVLGQARPWRRIVRRKLGYKQRAQHSSSSSSSTFYLLVSQLGIERTRRRRRRRRKKWPSEFLSCMHLSCLGDSWLSDGDCWAYFLTCVCMFTCACWLYSLQAHTPNTGRVYASSSEGCHESSSSMVVVVVLSMLLMPMLSSPKHKHSRDQLLKFQATLPLAHVGLPFYITLILHDYYAVSEWTSERANASLELAYQASFECGCPSSTIQPPRRRRQVLFEQNTICVVVDSLLFCCSRFVPVVWLLLLLLFGCVNSGLGNTLLSHPCQQQQ